jgi:hypothetical protein
MLLHNFWIISTEPTAAAAAAAAATATAAAVLLQRSTIRLSINGYTRTFDIFVEKHRHRLVTYFVLILSVRPNTKTQSYLQRGSVLRWGWEGGGGAIEVEMHEAASAAAQEVVAVHDSLQSDFVKLCDGACSVICCRMPPSETAWCCLCGACSPISARWRLMTAAAEAMVMSMIIATPKQTLPPLSFAQSAI